VEEIEVPLEKTQEDIEHAAHEAHEGAGHGSKTGWVTWSALLSALLAVCAAVASLNAGHHANEAMIDQIKSSDSWNYYQAKGIKASVATTRMEILEAVGKPVPEAVKAKIAQYADDQKEIQDTAKEQEATSGHHFEVHAIFAESVTFFQIAIAVTAIAVLVRRKQFLLVAGGFGAVGLYFLVQGFLAVARFKSGL
jgi:hypothetical protein